MHSDDTIRALRGSMDGFTPDSMNVIRVFFSSTFTDMQEERNLLMREAVPELKTYCDEMGFDLEIVDLRWGVREDAYADHATSDICMRAIEACQNTSQGPNFVVFVGNKYGSRPLPTAIPVTEFRLFRRLAYWMELNFETFEKWYLLDTNAVPPEYRILPITTLLPFYNNMNPVNKTRRLVHQDNWTSDERNMRNVLRKVALMALEQGKITAQQCDRYFISVTEAEVEKGLLNYKHVKDRVLCFHRSLLEIDTSDPLARRFIDLTSEGEVDKDAQDMLEKLSTVKIPKVLPQSQLIQNSVNWNPKGIDPEDDVHGRYLSMFCEWFKTLLKEQIDKAMNMCDETRIKNEMHAEVARHLATGIKKCQCCFGQDELINQIFKLMQKLANKKTQETQPKLLVDELEKLEQENTIEDDENKINESEKEIEEQEENTNKNDLIEEQPDNNDQTDKGDEGEGDEGEDEANPEKEEPVEEEEKETAEQKKMKEFDSLFEHLRNMGSNAPTIGKGLVGYDKYSDPKYNIRDELVTFTATEDYKQPIIIYGQSGCGKSTLMARLAQLIKTWEPRAVLIMRFLGTTSSSKTVRGVITSVISSIWAAYNVIPPGDLDFNSDIIYLGQYLQALIWQVSTVDTPLYILLDSLDQMAPLEQAHGLTWLPTILPPYGSFLVSTLPDHNCILDSAKRVLPNPEQFVEVLPITDAAAEKIISAIGNHKSRCISRPQRNFIIEKFRECPSPLFLKLITDQALSWRSHMLVKDLILGSNTVHAVNHLMMNLERTHGIILVSRAFGYLTSMKQGATFSEIDHLLSLDNEVLQDTFLFHLPPDSVHIRFPTSVWSTLCQDAGEYLTMEGNRGIMSWYHRTFHEVCAERFLTDESRKKIHCFAAKFFLGYWHKKIKPLKLYKNMTGWYPENVRMVPAQNLHFKDGRLNYRKLIELPHHLSQAGMWREFHKEIVCNISFLVAKVQACGVVELRADLMTFLKQRFEFTTEEEKDDVDDPPSEDDEEGEEEVKNKEEEKSDGNDQVEDEKVETTQPDEDLFLTENKKDGETSAREQSADKTSTTSTPVEEIKEETYQADLENVLRDVEILIDIINIGIDAIRQNAFSLPAQIICQLSKDKIPTPSLEKLLEDCFEYIEEHEKPMLKPLNACMAMPGGMLQTSINVNIHLKGEDRGNDSPIHFNAENFYLYAIQQANQKTDSLVVLDMAQGGEKVMMADLKAHAHSIRFNKNSKFLILCCYKELSRYQPSYFYKLYEGGQLAPYHLEKEALSMDVSSEGDIVAYADDRCCFICSPKREELTLEVIYRLHHTESITNVKFSPDAYYLLTFNQSDGFKVWVPRRGEATLSIEGRKTPSFSSKNYSGSVIHMTKTHRLIQVLSEYKKRSTILIHNLSSGEVIHELQSPELTYRIELMETDLEEEYLIVATQETSLVNGDRSKSAILWDIETGKVVSRVASTMSFASVKVLVDSNTIYIITAHQNSTIQVYSVGLRHRPLAGAKLIRTLQGHSQLLMQLSIIVPEGSGGGQRLISAASDNTVKFWDLQQVLTPEPKQTKKDVGESTRLVYSKDGRSVFYGTVNGFIEQMFIATKEKKCFASDLENPVRHLLVSKNGKLLIAAAKNMIYVYYIETGELEYALESCDQGTISCMAESNNVLVAGHSGMEAKGRLWDLSNGRVINDVSFLYSFYKTAVSPSGTQFGVTMFEYPIMMEVFGSGEMTNGVQMEQVDTMMAGCTHLEFSPNGKMLASSSVDGRIRIIDSETGRYLHTMIQPSSVTTFTFTWDSSLLLTAGYRSVYAWNVGEDHPDDEKGQLKVKLTRHGDFITAMQLVLDSRFLITGSHDKTIALWSMKTKTAICSFRAHCLIETMVVAPDLSSISYIPGQAANVAILTLNKSGIEALKELPDKPVPPTVKKAQAVALSFSTQEVTQKTSVACSIL